MGKPRDWHAIAAHFRRGGPMKHKNTPRSGAGRDPEIEEALQERAEKKLFEAAPKESGAAVVETTRCRCARCRVNRERPENYVCRWVCACCGNLLKEDPQIPPLPAQTLQAVGACCVDTLPEHLRSKAMPVRDIEKPLPGRFDQRAKPRLDDDPDALLRKEPKS